MLLTIAFFAILCHFYWRANSAVAIYLLCVLAFSSFTPASPCHICHSSPVSIAPLARTTKGDVCQRLQTRATSPLKADSTRLESRTRIGSRTCRKFPFTFPILCSFLSFHLVRIKSDGSFFLFPFFFLKSILHNFSISLY